MEVPVMKVPLRPVLVLIVTAAVAAGCGQDHTSNPGAGSQSAGLTGSAASVGSVASVGAKPVVAELNWSSGPVTVTHNPAVPPVPVVTGIRFAGHPQEGYDRIVFDIQGGLPGYTAKYVPQVRADGSDKPVPVPGKRFLLVVLNPAQAHTESGTPTVTGIHNAGLPMLKAYAIAGDFEGHVSIALGLNATAGYRIGELPGRIYVDVAT
jgi:hypothetical protein